MTLQSSGSISISQIATEKGVVVLGSGGGITGQSNLSLTSLSTTSINTASASKPDQAAPHAMSEFYGYNHNAVLAYCYQVYAGSGTTVKWTDASGQFHAEFIETNTTRYLCSQIVPYEDFQADLIVTACNTLCSQVHTTLSSAFSNPCEC